MNVSASSCPEADPDLAPSGEAPELQPCAAECAGKAVTLPHDLPVFLVGMMGAGKTTIGRSLARAWGATSSIWIMSWRRVAACVCR